ncbi:MAG: methyltransferase domain-containing protein [Rhodocyclaceae bacterium]
MANETTKQMLRRSSDRRFSARWIVGDGIDIGCGSDPLSKLADFFPLMQSLRPWDLPDGDAMLMAGVEDETYDFIHSSHCLEHLADPVKALSNWIRICKGGGHLVITVPDEDLYEQGVWPSTFNSDHKWTFTILKASSWSPRSVSVVPLLERFQDQVEILKVERLDSGFSYGQPRHDQTLGGLAESAIEFVLKKKARDPGFRSSEMDHSQAARFAEVAQRHEVSARFTEAVRLHQAGRYDEARTEYGAILSVDPRNSGTLNNLALLSPRDLAEQYLRQALAIKGDYLDALVNLANLSLADNHAVEAKALFLRALAVAPEDPRVISGLCQAYETLEAFDSAIQLLEDKKRCFPKLDDVYCRLAKYCENINRTDDALGYLNLALNINPGNVEAHVYAGRQYFKKGDYAKGAEGIAWIWRDRIPSSQVGLFVDEAGRPLRQDGRTIVLSADSGLGDTLQFVRYVRLLKDLGARVVVECQDELVRLIRHMTAVDLVHRLGQVDGSFAIRMPLHNLIGAFRSTVDTVPNAVPYLGANADELSAYRARMEPFAGLRVGLSWSGNPAHPRNARRSIAPDLMAPLLAQEGATFFSLQKGGETGGLNLVDWSCEFADMACTAALVANLDLVITVDSSIAHLAGALGRPVWLMNRFDSCWRWMEGRTDSPWYPTLTQFRQREPGQWTSVVDAVSAALATLVVQRRKERPGSGVSSSTTESRDPVFA